MEDSAAEVRGRHDELYQVTVQVGTIAKEEHGCLLRAKLGPLENTVQRLNRQQFELEIERQTWYFYIL